MYEWGWYLYCLQATAYQTKDTSFALGGQLNYTVGLLLVCGERGGGRVSLA